MLTKEQIDKYIKEKGVRCPYCNSDQIVGENIAWDIPLMQKIICPDCEKSWHDVLTVTDIIEE